MNFYGGSGSDALNGTTSADFMVGYGGNDTIKGAAGNDQLYAGSGADLLIGGAGRDYLKGEAGNDIFRFSLGDSKGGDVVADFTQGEDRISFVGVSQRTVGQNLTDEGLEISFGVLPGQPGAEKITLLGADEYLGFGDFMFG